MHLPPITYPFDTTGRLPSNLVTNDQHLISQNNYKDFYFVVPKFAPFFIESMVVTYVGDNVTRILIEGIDYYGCLPFIGASRSIGKPMYGGVSFSDLTLTGAVSLKYQTLGGDYLFDDQAVLENIANASYNPRIVTWEQVTNRPTLFPPTEHEWNLVDQVGQSSVVDALVRIEQAILTRVLDAFNLHMTNVDNPHNTNKIQIGLDLVENFPPASLAEAKALLATNRLITPATLKSVLDEYNGLKLSRLPGNLITLKSDGIYYSGGGGVPTPTVTPTRTITFAPTLAPTPTPIATATPAPTPVPTDHNFANVSLLLHGDGVNGSTTFVDNSSLANVVTAFGSAAVSITQSKFGGASCELTAIADYLQLPSGPQFAFSTDFTIECWAYFSANNVGYQGIVTAYAGGDQTAWALILEANNILTFYGSPGGGWPLQLTSATVPSINRWHHIAVARSGTTVSIWLNGVRVGSIDSSVSIASGSFVEIGNYPFFPTGRQHIRGFIDEIRITKGVARYTGNFTPTTVAFPNAS